MNITSLTRDPLLDKSGVSMNPTIKTMVEIGTAGGETEASDALEDMN